MAKKCTSKGNLLALCGGMMLGTSILTPAQAFELVGFTGLPQDPYWISVRCGADKAAEESGSKVDWYSAKSGGNNQEVLANLEAMKIAHPDGVITTAWNNMDPPAGWLKDFMEGGVPVVYVDAVPPDDHDFLKGFTVPGDDQIKPVAKAIAADVGESGQVAILGGVAGDETQALRWQGLKDTLQKDYPKVEVLDTQYTNYDVNKSNEVVSSLIVSNPELKVVFTSSGPEGQGARAAIKAAGKVGKVFVYSFDAIPALQDGVRDGSVKAVIGTSPRLQGATAVKTIVEYLTKNEGKGAIVIDKEKQLEPIPTMLITAENIDTPTANEYLIKDTCD